MQPSGGTANIDIGGGSTLKSNLPHLLIVDDEPTIHTLLVLVLEDLGVPHTSFYDIEGARRFLLDGGRFDVALVDKNLPDGSGLDLVKTLRDEAPWCEALLMTAQASLDSAIEAIQAGACDYVTKPFDDHAQLRLRVKSALEKVQLRHEQKRLLDQLAYDAMHDSLTGLANRALFVQQLEHTLNELDRAPERQFALLFMDVDRFKNVNDSLGHAEGDQLLLQVAERLLGCVRDCDLVARFGGDEFVILLRELKLPGDASRVSDRIHQAFDLPFRLGGQSVYVSSSIGVSFCMASRSAEDMLRDADLAMYRAKNLGKARTQFADSSLHETAMRTWKIENALRRGLQTGEIRPAFQPIIDLKTGHVAGFEALVRWESLELGTVAPVEFIGIAEEAGLVDAIFDRMVELSSAQLCAWQRAYKREDLFMSINLSARQLKPGKLVEQFFAALAQSEAKASQFELEITESALMADPQRALQIMHELREANVRLAIDDFGTGYSSLSYLSQLPATTLKLDRSFISEMTNNTARYEIVSFVADLGRRLDIAVTAEGIETTAQLEALCALGCTYGQGFLFAKPQTADALGPWLTERIGATAPKR